MNYYISDLHLGHKNALVFDNRPFESIEQMWSTIKNNWNSKVTDEDHVYILGDIAYRSKINPIEYLSKLNGKLHLVVGNHDVNTILKNENTRSIFESIDYYKRIDDGGRIVILCHYPIAVWDMKHRGSYHIYGHVHNQINVATEFMISQERAFNCGCMNNGYVPCSLEELEKNKKLL